MSPRALSVPFALALALASSGSGCDCGGTELTGVTEHPAICLSHTEVDFGTVAVGSGATQMLELLNCGDVDFPITAITFAEQGNAHAYALAQGEPPQLPTTLGIGRTLTLHLNFTPPALATYEGAFDIETDFTAEHVPVKGVGGPAVCGTTGTRPTATIRMKNGSTTLANGASVAPQSTISFDGSGSTVPRGGAKYAWTLTQKPGAQALSSTSAAKVTLNAAESGGYAVQLIVTDQHGCASAPATATLEAKSIGALHVELSWAENYGDVDLHFLGPGGTFDDDGTGGDPYSPSANGTDCFFADCKENPADHSDDNHTIDWGRNGTCAANGKSSDDPTLDLDDLWGNGPENLTHVEPFDATYTVLVHYYCSRESDGDGTNRGTAHATVKIWVDGVLKHTLTRALTQRDLWTAATVKVQNGRVTVTAPTPPSRLPKSTGRLDACTANTN